jgi:hypothetical protein
MPSNLLQMAQCPDIDAVKMLVYRLSSLILRLFYRSTGIFQLVNWWNMNVEGEEPARLPVTRCVQSIYCPRCEDSIDAARR